MDATLPWLDKIVRENDLTIKMEASNNRGWNMRIYKKGYDMPFVWVSDDIMFDCLKRGCMRLAKELDNLGYE